MTLISGGATSAFAEATAWRIGELWTRFRDRDGPNQLGASVVWAPENDKQEACLAYQANQVGREQQLQTVEPFGDRPFEVDDSGAGPVRVPAVNAIAAAIIYDHEIIFREESAFSRR